MILFADGDDLLSGICDEHCLQCVEQEGKHLCLACEEGFQTNADGACRAIYFSYGEAVSHELQ